MRLKRKIRKELIGTSDYPSNKVFTVSNFITGSRLILTLVFLFLFVTDVNRYVALVIYAIAACTDWLDGQIARMTKTVSWLGKLMDPLVDRALLFTGVLGLVIRSELPVWICILIIARDAYLALGNFIVHHFHRRPIDVVYTGKAATALLMAGFTLMLLGKPIVEGLDVLPADAAGFPGLNGEDAPFGIFLVYLGSVFSILTALVYTAKGVLLVKRSQEHPEDEEEDFLNPEIVESDDDGPVAEGFRDSSEVE
ncbi:CDP-alcohol phosphatidyltransferase [Coriobacterium glomerans PW2]|uniref:CDP-alcohol phosphatidyltransferase n=1 Tax=Coriobacterium glomerans (strain ATCC 49209 / DSM 20642 / JCM 10262 / PW2) TaxID=700015 RepID=F2N7V8_CORGP|nr:CDP-alcohol phosphatidyltransferase family protein [Coriobacterium glomerans]AEB07067.1 CDP-alcohol phosphatidyltransferase [Coriobacterium glomerans PW2]